METTQDGTEVLETTVEAAAETAETPEITADQIAELREKAAKADELEEKNKQLFERAKKAEAKVPSKEIGEFNSKDILYLAKADIHEDDLNDVAEYAKLKKITVSEAHKFMKPILDVRAQERRTAEATHIKGGARGSSKVTGQDLLQAAERGEEIDLDDDKSVEIFKARQARKIKKR